MKTLLPLGLAVAATLASFGLSARAEEPVEELVFPLTAAVASVQTVSGWNVEFRHWQQGQAPVKLIRQNEGVCALTSVTGNFQGAGEQVRVYVGEDHYWYLGGTSHQEGVAADCVIVRFPSAGTIPSAPVVSGPSAAPKPAASDPVKILAASYSFGSHYADVTGRVRMLVMQGETFQANPGCLLTDPQPGWNKALVIFCEVRGKRSIFSVGEGEGISKDLILKDARPVTD